MWLSKFQWNKIDKQSRNDERNENHFLVQLIELAWKEGRSSLSPPQSLSKWKRKTDETSVLESSATMELPFSNCVINFSSSKHLSLPRINTNLLLLLKNPSYFSSVPSLRRRKRYQFSPIQAATTTSDATRRTITSSETTVGLQLGKSSSGSSAMEQLDIERGVCVPFRKYSPETVRIYIYTFHQLISTLLFID